MSPKETANPAPVVGDQNLIDFATMNITGPAQVDRNPYQPGVQAQESLEKRELSATEIVKGGREYLANYMTDAQRFMLAA